MKTSYAVVGQFGDTANHEYAECGNFTAAKQIWAMHDDTHSPVRIEKRINDTVTKLWASEDGELTEKAAI